MIIQNGTGKDISAKVYDNYHLGVQAIAEPLIGYKSRVDQDGFSTFLPGVYPIAASENTVFVIYNGESEKLFIINKLFISHTGGATFNRMMVARMYKSSSAPTAGILTGAPIKLGNLNIGSSKITDVTAYIWDGSTGTGMTGASTGSMVMCGLFPPAFTQVDLSGSLVLSPGQYIRVTFEGLVATSACMTISGYLSTVLDV